MKRALLAARIAASVGALAMIIWRVDAASTWDAITTARPAWIAVALAFNIAAVAFSTALWRAMTPAGALPFRRAFGMYLAGIFHNNLGLGTTVGDTTRVAGMREAGTRTHAAAASVLAERALSFGALLVLASVGAFVIVDTHALLAGGIWTASASAVIAAVAISLAAPRITRWPRVPRRGAALASDVSASLAALLRNPRRLAAGGSLAVAVQLCTVAATLCLLRAVSADGSMLIAAAVVPAIAFCVLLPVSIQGIGVRETTYVALFGIAGVASEQALAAAVLSYAATLAISALGAAVIARDVAASARRPAGVADDEPLRMAA